MVTSLPWRARSGFTILKSPSFYVFAEQAGFGKWEWGSGIEGFPDTATELRQALVKNPYLKVLVMEGYFDLATPYFAAAFNFSATAFSRSANCFTTGCRFGSANTFVSSARLSLGLPA